MGRLDDPDRTAIDCNINFLLGTVSVLLVTEWLY